MHYKGLLNNGLADNRNYFASWGPQAARQTLSGSLVVEFQSAPPFEPYLSGLDLNGNGVVESAGESVLGGSPLPGIGYNQFGVRAGKLTPLGQVIPAITLPANFSFPHSFNSQNLRGQATQRTPNIFGTGGPRAFQLGSRILF